MRREDHHGVADGGGEIEEAVHGLRDQVARVVDLRGEDRLDGGVRVVDGGVARRVHGRVDEECWNFRGEERFGIRLGFHYLKISIILVKVFKLTSLKIANQYELFYANSHEIE